MVKWKLKSQRHTKHESSSDNKDVHQDDFLQAKGIRKIQEEVNGGCDTETVREFLPRKSDDGYNNRQHNDSLRNADEAACDRPVPFDRVLSVGFAVCDIVDDVRCTRNEGEYNQRENCSPGVTYVKEML